MSTQKLATPKTTTTTALPTAIDTPRAKLVYLYLDTVGGATVEELQDALDMQKIALFGIVDTLTTKNLVAKDGDRYVLA